MSEYKTRNVAFSVAGVNLTGDGVVAFSAQGQCLPFVGTGVGKATVDVTDRGNASQQVSITVLRRFATDDALEAFVAGHFGSLTRSGALVVTTGTVSTTTKTATSACIVGVVSAEPEALILLTTYSITCSPLL